uniref:FMRFamide-related neuropeptides-like n=1 Tax=Syphacia muris TaxID=451379 RepID=A0A0N5AQ68_9BILA
MQLNISASAFPNATVQSECCYGRSDSAFCKLFQTVSKSEQDAIRYLFKDDCSELEAEYEQKEANSAKEVAPITMLIKETIPEVQYDTANNDYIPLNIRSAIATKNDYYTENKGTRNFLRFGKRDDINFYRYNRDRQASGFLRDVKSAHSSKPNFLRFGKRQFSRRSPFSPSLIRDQKGGPNFLRFG